MKTLLLILLTFCPVATLAQNQQASPESKLIEFQMAILKRGPKWSANPGKDAPTVQQQHVDYVQSLLNSGRAMIAGAIKDESNLVGVYIFRTKSADEAKSWVNADPAVVAEHVV